MFYAYGSKGTREKNYLIFFGENGIKREGSGDSVGKC
jgi:hypothetical protein